MIKEYALDPNLLESWERVRYYCEMFGYDKGRLISEYPRKWKKMVWASVSTAMPVERKRIEEFLSRMDSRLIRRNRTYDGNLAWLTNAEREHQRQPFAAILAVENPNGNDFVIPNEEIADVHPLITSRKLPEVRRTPEAMAEAMGHLFETAKRVLFIDPHFDPEPSQHHRNPKFRPTRWTRPLIEFVGRVSSECHLEYHTLRQSNRGSRPMIAQAHELDMAKWKRHCCEELPHVLPQGARLTIYRWQERIDGPDFHARFVLSDRCGTLVERGLDADLSTSSDFTTMSFLGELDRVELEARFAESATVYDLISKHEVLGIGDCLVAREGERTDEAT
jgi:hypothetical protein